MPYLLKRVINVQRVTCVTNDEWSRLVNRRSLKAPYGLARAAVVLAYEHAPEVQPRRRPVNPEPIFARLIVFHRARDAAGEHGNVGYAHFGV